MNLLQNLQLVEYLYRGRRTVLLQTFTTRHSNCKLSIVMALSTTFTQCAPETTKFSKIAQNKGHLAVQGHWGHRFLYQSKTHIRLPISRRWLDKYCALSLEFMNLLGIYTVGVAPTNLQIAVYYQTIIVNCNRKLSIVMALLITFTQCAPEIIKFGKITQNKGNYVV